MAAGAAPRSEPDIAFVGALIGDPTRARLLIALADGRALPASRLAAEAGVAPSTMSEHLARLTAAGLLAAHAERRSRLYQLASPAVADAIRAVAAIAPARSLPPARQDGHADGALRLARTCYRHLGGRLGAALFGGLLDRGLLTGGDGRQGESGPGGEVRYLMTARGERVFSGIGVDVPAVLAKRPPVRYCVDWSERRHHLAGPLGTALAERVFTLGWACRTGQRRGVQITDIGRERFSDVFGLPADWDRLDAAFLARAG